MAVYFLKQVHLLNLSRHQRVFKKGKSSLEVEPLRTTAIVNELRRTKIENFNEILKHISGDLRDHLRVSTIHKPLPVRGKQSLQGMIESNKGKAYIHVTFIPVISLWVATYPLSRHV